MRNALAGTIALSWIAFSAGLATSQEISDDTAGNTGERGLAAVTDEDLSSADPALPEASLPSQDIASFSSGLTLGEELLLSGDSLSAIAVFEQMLNGGAGVMSQRERAMTQGALGLALAAAGRTNSAGEMFDVGVATAREANALDVMARNQYNKGLLLAQIDTTDRSWIDIVASQANVGQTRGLARVDSAPDDADTGYASASDNFETFRSALTTAREAGAFDVAANAAASAVDLGADAPPALTLAVLNEGEAAAGSISEPVKRAEAEIALAAAAIDAFVRTGDPELREAAFQVTSLALSDARAIGNARLEAYALGLMGRIYAVSGRVEDGAKLARAAWIQSRDGGAQGARFELGSQYALLAAALGETDNALAAYEDAAETIERIRPALASQSRLAGEPSLRQLTEPALLSYADMLLREAQAASEAGEASAPYLARAREVMELLKVMEMERFFGNVCLGTSDNPVSLDGVPGDTAVIYPISLDDRLELIISKDGKLTQRTVPIGASELTDIVISYRENLRFGSSTSYQQPASQLYDALIRPLEDILQSGGIDTIAFAPDGPLRTVPLSALYDGENFLIETYAVSTVVGLSLVDTRPIASVERRMVFAGLSDSVQGFSPLTGVESEIASIRDIKSGPVVFNAEFDEDSLAAAIASNEATISHLASHAVFGKTPQESFILTYEGRIDLNELRDLVRGLRSSTNGLELLTLSACETARGDDDAILGLAGVAYSAGARAVLASLWPIPDEATSQLMPQFYDGLLNGNETKAQALREAQLALISDPATRHPYNWSAFIIVGNWF